MTTTSIDFDQLPKEIFLVDFQESYPTESIFLGTGFSKSSIVFGTEGWKKSEKELRMRPEYLIGGKYAGVFVEQDRCTIFCDAFAQESIFFWKPRNDAGLVISNSFLAICKYLHKKGVSLRLRKSTLFGFKFSNGGQLGAQIFQDGLPVKEVSMLPRGSVLRILKSTLATSVEKVRLSSELAGDKSSGMHNFLTQSFARVRSLAQVPDSHITCDLSGGRDSRLVFGIIANSGIGLEQVNIFSQISKENEYLIASEVARLYGSQVSPLKIRATKKISLISSAARWLYGSCGLYLPIYTSRTASDERFYNFSGANFVAIAFARRAPEGLMRDIARSLSRKGASRENTDELVHNFSSWFLDNDLDLGERDSMQHHYQNFRARFHYGRNSLSTGGTEISPLLDLSLSSLYKPGELVPDGMYTDLFLNIDPRLIEVNFDQERKNINQELILNSTYYNNRVSVKESDIPELNVFHSNDAKSDDDRWESLVMDYPVKDSKSDRDFLLSLFDDVKQASLDAGIFSLEEVNEARESIISCERLSHNARLASHIIQVGILAGLTVS